MPIYAFECDACGHEFERLQKMSEDDPKHCPSCNAEAVRRQLTAPQFRLSGSGWYETDFKKDGDKKRNLTGDSGSSSDSSKTEAKSEAKTESKPAAKTETAAAPKSDA